MAKTPSAVRFQELSNKDRILLTYTDHSRYLDGSVQAMELIDEIHELNRQLRERSHLEHMHHADMDRSCILIGVLQLHKMSLERDLESEQLDAGEL